jgi:hypothetical protein
MLIAGVEVEIPDGWYVVSSGRAQPGDQAWEKTPEGGRFDAVGSVYGLEAASAYWCLIREYKDPGAAI